MELELRLSCEPLQEHEQWALVQVPPVPVTKKIMKPHRIPSDMPVMPQRCKSCPFNPGPNNFGAALRSRIEGQVLSEASQTCHSTGSINGERDTHLCRGARDYQLQIFHGLGFLDAPTDEAWDKKMKSILRQAQHLQRTTTKKRKSTT